MEKNFLYKKEFKKEDINYQMEFWELMGEQSLRYTMGDSSSIPIEIAEELKKSIDFCIKISLKNTDINNMKLKEIFLNGREEVKKLVEHGKKLYKAVLDTAVKIDNIAYNDTIREIELFFKYYDINFMSHDIPCMIDYQLFKGIEHLEGIEFINEYLERLIIENEFCQNFKIENIISLLKAYCYDYREDVINIFEPVFNNAVGLSFLDKDIFELNINEKDKLDLLNYSEVISIDKISKQLIIEDNHLDYLNFALGELKVRMDNQRNMDFNNIFISFDDNINNNTVIFENGESMSDESLRELINNINEIDCINDKIYLLKSNIKNVKDLAELLESCFWNEEFFEVYKQFSNIEISILLNYLYSEFNEMPKWGRWLLKFGGVKN